MPQPDHKRRAAKEAARAAKQSGRAPARALTLEQRPEYAHMSPYELLSAWMKPNRGWGLHVAEKTGGAAGRVIRCASLGSSMSQAMEVTGLSGAEINTIAREIGVGAIEAEVKRGDA